MSLVDLFIGGRVHGADGVLSRPGTIWEDKIPSGDVIEIKGIAYDGTTLVVAGRESGGDFGTWASTDNGDTFGSFVAGGTMSTARDMDSPAPGIFLVCGDGGLLHRSTDSGASWSAMTSGFGSDDIYNMTSDNSGNVVAVGENGKISLSDDSGATWSLLGSTPLGSGILNGVAYGAHRFIATGASGVVGTCEDTDLETWTTRTSGFGSSIVQNVQYSDDLNTWVIVGQSGKTGRSEDNGTTWSTPVVTDASENHNDLTSDLGVFVSMDTDSVMWQSLDAGRTWQSLGSGGTGVTFDACVAGDNRLIMAIGGTTPYMIVSDWLEAGAGIVEQGSGTDGEYVIFSNGLQICWDNAVSVAATSLADVNIGTYGWSFYHGSTAATFAKAFGSVPTVSPTGSQRTDAQGMFSGRIESIATSGCTVTQYNNGSATWLCGYIAIGQKA